MAMTLFAGLAAFSVWWLRTFRYGPAEWLWRRLTYGGNALPSGEPIWPRIN